MYELRKRHRDEMAQSDTKLITMKRFKQDLIKLLEFNTEIGCYEFILDGRVVARFDPQFVDQVSASVLRRALREAALKKLFPQCTNG